MFSYYLPITFILKHTVEHTVIISEQSLSEVLRLFNWSEIYQLSVTNRL